MPYLPPRVCSRHQKIKIEKNKPCPLCVKEKNARARNRMAKKPRLYDRQIWKKKIRPGKLAANPLCELCEKNNILKVATEVDHINPIESGGDPFDFDNLQSLCKSCHSRKTASENNVFGHDKAILD